MGLSDNDTALNIWMQAHDQTGPAVTSAEGKFSKFSGTISKTTVAFSALGAGAGLAAGFLSEAAKASAEDEASTARLRVALENTGVKWSDYSDKVDATIKKGQELAFSDDQTRDSLATMAAESGSAEEAFKRQGLAMDLARGMNIDLHKASVLLGKVTDENIKVLGKYGIHVAAVTPTQKQHEVALKAEAVATDVHTKAQQLLSDELAKLHGRTKLTIQEQIRMRDLHKNVTDTANKLAAAHKNVAETTQEGANQAALFAAVQAKFGGQAEAYGHSTAGAIDRVKDAIGEWKESIGAALGPAQPFVALLPGISAGMTLAGSTLGPVASGLINVAKSEKVAELATRALTLATGPVGLVLLGISAAVALLAFAWSNNWGDIRGKTEAVIKFLTPLLSTFAAFFGALWETLGPIVQTAIGVIMVPINFLIDRVKDAIGFLEKLGIIHMQAKQSGALDSTGANSTNNGKGLKAAAGGYEGWVTQPTTFLTGEGGEPEYVSVTPRSRAGGGGNGGVIVNFNGPVTVDSPERVQALALEFDRKRRMAGGKAVL